MIEKQPVKFEKMRGNQNARAKDPRIKKVTVRFTAGEYETISGEAESQGQGISDYIREWVLPR